MRDLLKSFHVKIYSLLTSSTQVILKKSSLALWKILKKKLYELNHLISLNEILQPLKIASLFIDIKEENLKML